MVAAPEPAVQASTALSVSAAMIASRSVQFPLTVVSSPDVSTVIGPAA